MVSRKNIFATTLFVLALMLIQSCVHGNLDECPPSIRYAMSFEYTNNTDGIDRFYEDVKKVNLFIFDKNGKFISTKEVVGPFEQNFNIPLDLPQGSYKIITWGNALEGDHTIIPTNFVEGVTTIDQARIELNLAADRMSDDELEKLFYGEKNVTIAPFTSKVDTISLDNNTNKVRIVLYDIGAIAPGIISMRIVGNNADYDFHNNPIGNVTYLPYETFNDGQILDTDTWFTKLKDLPTSANVAQVADFSMLRLMENQNFKLEITLDNGTKELIYVDDIIRLLKEAGKKNSISIDQAYLDKQDIYEIILPWPTTTGTMHLIINGWHLIYVPSEVWRG